MPQLFFSLLFSLLVVSAASATQPTQAIAAPSAATLPLGPEAVKKALDSLLSPSSEVRTKTAAALRLRCIDERQKEQVREIFSNAQAKHKETLETVVKRGVPGLDKFKLSHDAWASKRTEVMKLILTDYHKDGAKVAMLTKEHLATEALRKTMDREFASTQNAWKTLASSTSALEEMDRQKALLEGAGGSYVAKKPEAYLAEISAAREMLQTMNLLMDRQRTNDEMASVTKHNASMKGIPPTAVIFAGIINQRRSTMNLAPLRLDTQLSQAAASHSKEMMAMGYFAHESPVAANKTPGDRARKASFTGGWSGENIFMGSPGANEAYNAWWGSDGHRFIMFADGPNTLGLGPVGNYWTLMTGHKKWQS